MVRRREWIGSIAAALLAVWTPRRAQAQVIDTTNSTGIGDNNIKFLEEQLRTSLRVFTEGQRQYIHQVVALVMQGRLPRPMVNLVARWAVERNPSVPFPYFQYALRVLGKRRHIPVP